jgi:hypothetical protein
LRVVLVRSKCGKQARCVHRGTGARGDGSATTDRSLYNSRTVSPAATAAMKVAPAGTALDNDGGVEETEAVGAAAVAVGVGAVTGPTELDVAMPTLTDAVYPAELEPARFSTSFDATDDEIAA